MDPTNQGALDISAIDWVISPVHGPVPVDLLQLVIRVVAGSYEPGGRKIKEGCSKMKEISNKVFGRTA